MITRIFRGKLVVIGDQGVGKTSMVNMFVSDGRDFPKNYIMTFAAEISAKTIPIPNTSDAVEFIIYDCPGINLYTELLNSFWNKPDLLMVVFDVTNPNSLESVGHWVNLANKAEWQGDSGAPVSSVLLGNKIDMENRVACTEADAVQMADRYKMKYFQASVKSNQGLEDPFQFLADTFYKHCLKKHPNEM